MSLLNQVQDDVKTAMKAGERERVHALRMIADALQKAEKDNGGDPVEVLQRERKRRLEAAEAYRDGGRTDAAEAEEREAEIITSYMPEQISDEDLHAIVGDAVAESGASSPQEMGKVMAVVMPQVKGRADGKRVSAAVKEMLTPKWPSAIQLELPNEVAAELAGPGDAVMKTLEEHLDCEVFLRGNVLTLDGDDDAVATARTVVREMTDLVRQGHEIAPGTIEAIAGALDRHESPSRILEDVVWRHRSLKVAPKTVNQKHYVDAIRRSTITVGVGPAGTGKSFLAVAMAVAALSRREVNRIVLTRPAVEAGERLGFLPGDIAAKVDPYLRPLFDALYDMLEPEKVNQHLERGVIEVAPLAFMRGRTLNDSFIILDEAQNTSPEQIKMFLTRLGFNSKMVVTGDITQIDLPKDQHSGLVMIADILKDVDGIEFVRFGGEDVVRHKLVQRIVAAYSEYAEQQAPPLRQARRQQG